MSAPEFQSANEMSDSLYDSLLSRLSPRIRSHLIKAARGPRWKCEVRGRVAKMVSAPIRFDVRQVPLTSATRSRAKPQRTQRSHMFWSPWRPWRLWAKSILSVSTYEYPCRDRIQIEATQVVRKATPATSSDHRGMPFQQEAQPILPALVRHCHPSDREPETSGRTT